MTADPRYFSRDHLEKARFNAPASLAEEAVHCLELVSELVESGLSFQFKGGNSLLLILEEPKRFSIDVDIATGEQRERIEQCLDTIVGRYGIFKRWENRPHKTKPWLPIASYYVHFDSVIREGADTSIMLDAQLRRSPYRTESNPIVCGALYESTVCVELPLPASIIGDKLLTLGPETLGIPVGKGKEAQRLKHVFDISRLLATYPLLSDIRESFFACIRHENELQDRVKSTEEIIDDTLAFCWSSAKFPTMPPETGLSPIEAENVRGLPLFASHLFEAGYVWTDLQRDMARVAACVAAMRLRLVSDSEFLATFASPGSFGGPGLANGILRDNPEAAKYWECVMAWSEKTPWAELP